jgi:hypothetical protein
MMSAPPRVKRAMRAILWASCGASLLLLAQPGTRRAPAGPAPDDAATQTAATGHSLGAVDQGLQSRDLEVLRETALRCADLGPDAAAHAPRLRQLLDDDDQQLRGNAAYALLRMNCQSQSALQVLIDQLSAKSARQSCRAAFMLGDLGASAAPALPRLRELLAGEEPLRRLHAAEALLKINAREWNASCVLVEALESDSREARFFAACVLGMLPLAPDEALEARLMLATADPDANVASAATVTLLLWHARRQSLPGSRQAATAPDAPDPHEAALVQLLDSIDPGERRSAAAALAVYGHTSAQVIPVVRRRLADADPLVRACAARILWQLEGRARALTPALRNLVETGDAKALLPAACILGQIGPPAVDALVALRRQAQPGGIEGLALAAAMLRIELTDAEARETVLGALVDPSSDMRSMGARLVPLLPVSDDSELLAGLALGLRDEKLRVRVAARKALEQLETRGIRDTIEEALRLIDEEALPAVSEGNPRTAAKPRSEVASNPVRLIPPESEAEVQADHLSGGTLVALAPRIVPLIDDGAVAQEPSGVGLGQIVTDDAGAAAPEELQGAHPPMHPEPARPLRPINTVRARIKPPEGALPEDLFGSDARATPMQFHNLGAARGWRQNLYCWDAPALCFGPLYFEEINSERFGWRVPYLQSFYSGAMFGLNCLILPVRVVAEPPRSCVYALGHDRPGSCVPVRCYCPKLIPDLACLHCNSACEEE